MTSYYNTNPNPNVGVAGHVTALDQSNFSIQNRPNYTTYDAFKSRLKLAARAVLSADAGLLVTSNSDGKRPKNKQNLTG